MASPSVQQIDPRRPGQYTLKIGKDLKSGSSKSSFSSVKFNHKPTSSSGTRSTQLSRGKDGEASLAIIDNEDGKPQKYAYKGRRRAEKNSYVLIFDPATQSCTLEPVKAAYNFNITSTPWEASSEKLARQYEQLRPNDVKAVESANLDEDPDGEAEAENPYDFRHYLNAQPKGQSPVIRPASTANTSTLSSSRTAPEKTRSRPASKVDPLRQAPRKKATSAASKASQKPTPTVRLDRRASTRPGDKIAKPVKAAPVAAKSEYYVHSSDEDAEEANDDIVIEKGGLEIDWGNEAPKKSKARVLDLPPSSHDRPISLHSAANSPMGRIITPNLKREEAYKNQDVIDFDTDDDGGADVHMRDAEEASDGDGDIEPMELGSPAHVKVDEVLTPEEMADDADFDAEFEAEMMQGLASGDEEDEGMVAREESESESEAE